MFFFFKYKPKVSIFEKAAKKYGPKSDFKYSKRIKKSEIPKPKDNSRKSVKDTFPRMLLWYGFQTP